MFLHRIDFYGTLLARFVEYIFTPLQQRFSTNHGANQELEYIKNQMILLKVSVCHLYLMCRSLLRSFFFIRQLQYSRILHFLEFYDLQMNATQCVETFL